jgi:threonine aldolase
MLSFENDYSAGAHPEVLKHLQETNMEILSGYGTDTYTDSAKEKIKKFFNCPEGDVYFITGGTQTNQLIISTMLENYEGVVAATTGHVSGHEAGAIEYTGHKVLTVPGHAGKMDAGELKVFLQDFYADGNHEHMVFPGMVYISFPTEYGTIYSKKELEDIYAVCREFDMPLFIDGARLGYGLVSSACDIKPEDLPKLCDVFYAGGTKVGALCGEAVVFTHNNAPGHFVTQIKQHGALLAKGRLNSVQFDALFTDNLYLKISQNAIDLAEELKKIFAERGYKFFLDSPTNQQFFIMENSKLEELKDKVKYGFWEKYDETHTVVRFATAWYTKKEDLEELKKYI